MLLSHLLISAMKINSNHSSFTIIERFLGSQKSLHAVDRSVLCPHRHPQRPGPVDVGVLGAVLGVRPAPHLVRELRVTQVLDGLLPHLPGVADGVDLAGPEVPVDGRQVVGEEEAPRTRRPRTPSCSGRPPPRPTGGARPGSRPPRSSRGRIPLPERGPERIGGARGGPHLISSRYINPLQCTRSALAISASGMPSPSLR